MNLKTNSSMSTRKINEIYSARRELVEAEGVTLDGRPAKVSGVYNDSATVWSLDGTVSVPFSWDAVKRIVVDGGKFTSK